MKHSEETKAHGNRVSHKKISTEYREGEGYLMREGNGIRKISLDILKKQMFS